MSQGAPVPTLEEQVHKWDVADGGVSLLEQSNRAVNRFNPSYNMSPVGRHGPKYSRDGWLLRTPAMRAAEAAARAKTEAHLREQYGSNGGGGGGGGGGAAAAALARPRSAPAGGSAVRARRRPSGSGSGSGGGSSMPKRRPAPSTPATQRMLQLVTAETHAKTGEKLCINEELREVRGSMGRARQKLFTIQEKKIFDGFLAYTDADARLARRVAYCVDAAGATLLFDGRELRKPGGATGGALSAHAGGRFAHAPPRMRRPFRAEGEGTRAPNAYATLVRRCASFVLLLTDAACVELSELLPGERSPLLLRQCEAAVAQSEKDGSKLVTLVFEGPGELCGSAPVADIEPSVRAAPLVARWEAGGRPVAAADDELLHLECSDDDDGGGGGGGGGEAAAEEEEEEEAERGGGPNDVVSWKAEAPTALRPLKRSELHEIVSRMPNFRSSSCGSRTIRDTLGAILLGEGSACLSLTASDCGAGARGGRGGVRRLGALDAVVAELLTDDRKVSLATKALPKRQYPQGQGAGGGAAVPEDDPMPVLRHSTELFLAVGSRQARMRDMRVMALRQAGDRILARMDGLGVARRYGAMLAGLREAAALYRGLDTRPIRGRYGSPYERLRKREDGARKRGVREPERKLGELATADGQRLLRLARLACDLGHFEEAALLTMDARRCFRWVGFSDREAGVTELRRIVQTRVVKARRAAGIISTLADDEFG